MLAFSGLKRFMVNTKQPSDSNMADTAVQKAFAKPVTYMWALIGRADTGGHEKAQMIISYGPAYRSKFRPMGYSHLDKERTVSWCAVRPREAAFA